MIPERIHADNVNDMIERGRGGNSGATNPSVVLSEYQVREIRTQIDIGARNCDLAEKYGVDPSTISHIKARRLWKDL